MRKFSTSIVMMIALLFIGGDLLAQKLSIEEVAYMERKNSGPITDGEQVVGYYFFYKVEKKDKKNNFYLLQIADEDVNIVAEKKMIKPKTVNLTEMEYNGEALLTSFYDTEEKKYTITTYDSSLERLGGKKYSQYNEKAKANTVQNKIVSAGDKGFIRYSTKTQRKQKGAYLVQYFTNDADRTLSWKLTSSRDQDYHCSATHGAIEDSLLVFFESKMKSFKDQSLEVAGVNVNNGDRLFSIELPMDEHTLFPLGCYIEDDRIVITGDYYPPSVNIANKASLGVFFVEFNRSGEIVNESYLDWKEGFKEFLTDGEVVRMEKAGRAFFHDMIKLKDGRYFSVGEFYKKGVSGKGVAASALALASRGYLQSNVAIFDIEVSDLVFLEFDEEMNLTDVDYVEKKKRNVDLPYGAGLMSANTWAKFVWLYGGFGYSFTQVDKDNEHFTVAYSGKDKESGRDGFLEFYSKSAGEDDLVVDRMEMQSEANRMFVRNAKTGYVMVFEYYKKEKRLDVHLEKINY